MKNSSLSLNEHSKLLARLEKKQKAKKKQFDDILKNETISPTRKAMFVYETVCNKCLLKGVFVYIPVQPLWLTAVTDFQQHRNAVGTIVNELQMIVLEQGC